MAARAVGLIVIFLGVRVVRDTTLLLMDTMPDAQSMDQIRKVALSVPGAEGIEKCFARKTGLKWHVDLHLEVDPEMSVLAIARDRHAGSHPRSRKRWIGWRTCWCTWSRITRPRFRARSMENREIARILAETADLMEIAGEDGFRIRSYRNAASAIEGYPERVQDIVVEPGAEGHRYPGSGQGNRGRDRRDFHAGQSFESATCC